MKQIVTIIGVVFLVCGICDVGWGGKPFAVVGKSEQTEAVPNPTLEMAIQDGLMRAVEEVVGGMVVPQTMKRRQEILSQTFYKQPDAYILSYKILEKTRLATGYQVLLECVVDTPGIEKRLTALGLLDRERRSHLRKIRVVVSGIRSYDAYLAIEQLLREDTEVHDFSLSEIEPTIFTWVVTIQGETGRLANKLLYHDFGGLKARVVALKAERLEVALSR